MKALSEIEKMGLDNNQLKRKLESQKTALLSYPDIEGVILKIQNYLLIIQMIGNKKANGEKLFKTKSINKLNDALNQFHSDYCNTDGTSPKANWNGTERPLLFEKMRCMAITQQQIIDSATVIYVEEYKTCSRKKMDLIFGADSMIKDVVKAIEQIPTAWNHTFSPKQLKLSA